eukprot:gene18205-24649_t
MASFAAKTNTMSKSSNAIGSRAMPAVRPVSVRPVRSAARPCLTRSHQAAAEGTSVWENQIKTGNVTTVSPKDISTLMEQGWTVLDVRPPAEASVVSIVNSVQGWTVLDVRPPAEASVVSIVDSVQASVVSIVDSVLQRPLRSPSSTLSRGGLFWMSAPHPAEAALVSIIDSVQVSLVSIVDPGQVPMYIKDPDAMTPAGLIKQWLNLGMGGWWLGGWHLVPNTNFMGEVQAKVPKDAKIIGLRSLAASESLIRAGYTTVGWVNGGFDACRQGDFPTTPDNKDIRYAAVGGVSGILGWTDGGQSGVIGFFVFLLACDFALFGYEYFQTFQETGKLPWEL